MSESDTYPILVNGYRTTQKETTLKCFSFDTSNQTLFHFLQKYLVSNFIADEPESSGDGN